MKKCTKCNEVKELGEFYKSTRYKDGVYSSCKLCSAKYARDWQDKNLDRVRKSQRAYREKHPELLEKTRERVRSWSAKNPERHRERSRRWERDHPAEATAHTRKKQLRKLQAEGNHTIQEWEEKKAEYHFLCAYCREPKKLEKDHVVPLSRGGSDYISNIVPSCQLCNSSKHNLLLDEWLKRQKRLGSS